MSHLPPSRRLVPFLRYCLLLGAAIIAVATAVLVAALAGSALDVPPGFPPWIKWAIGIGGSLLAVSIGLSAALLQYALGNSLKLLVAIEERLSDNIGDKPIA